jgi:hypothetical protein
LTMKNQKDWSGATSEEIEAYWRSLNSVELAMFGRIQEAAILACQTFLRQPETRESRHAELREDLKDLEWSLKLLHRIQAERVPG